MKARRIAANIAKLPDCTNDVRRQIDLAFS